MYFRDSNNIYHKFTCSQKTIEGRFIILETAPLWEYGEYMDLIVDNKDDKILGHTS